MRSNKNLIASFELSVSYTGNDITSRGHPRDKNNSIFALLSLTPFIFERKYKQQNKLFILVQSRFTHLKETLLTSEYPEKIGFSDSWCMGKASCFFFVSSNKHT